MNRGWSGESATCDSPLEDCPGSTCVTIAHRRRRSGPPRPAPSIISLPLLPTRRLPMLSLRPRGTLRLSALQAGMIC